MSNTLKQDEDFNAFQRIKNRVEKRVMKTYEVRTSKTIFNYYRFKAKDAAHAEQMALTFGKIGRIDTIHDKKKVDYSKEL